MKQKCHRTCIIRVKIVWNGKLGHEVENIAKLAKNAKKMNLKSNCVRLNFDLSSHNCQFV